MLTNVTIRCCAYFGILCLLILRLRFYNKPPISHILPTRKSRYAYYDILSCCAYCAIVSQLCLLCHIKLQCLAYCDILSLLGCHNKPITYLQYHSTPTVLNYFYCAITSLPHALLFPISVSCYACNIIRSCRAHCAILCLLYAIQSLQCHTKPSIIKTMPTINKTLLDHLRR